MDLESLPEIERDLKEAASYLQRRKDKTNRGGTKGNDRTNEQARRDLERWAKARKLWIHNVMNSF